MSPILTSCPLRKRPAGSMFLLVFPKAAWAAWFESLESCFETRHLRKSPSTKALGSARDLLVLKAVASRGVLPET